MTIEIVYYHSGFANIPGETRIYPQNRYNGFCNENGVSWIGAEVPDTWEWVETVGGPVLVDRAAKKFIECDYNPKTNDINFQMKNAPWWNQHWFDELD